MTANSIRKIIYRHSVEVSALLATISVISVHLISAIPAQQADKPTMITISVTLAGFLFTGQGIMITLPTNNSFMQMVREHGYLNDFHKLCRWAEMVFIASVVFSLEAITRLIPDQALANFLYLIIFLWPLFMAFWALWIFGNVIGMLHQ